jgi:hypothetical protein
LTAFLPNLPKTAISRGFRRYRGDSVAFAAESRNAKKLIYGGFGRDCRSTPAVFRRKRLFSTPWRPHARRGAIASGSFLQQNTNRFACVTAAAWRGQADGAADRRLPASRDAPAASVVALLVATGALVVVAVAMVGLAMDPAAAA